MSEVPSSEVLLSDVPSSEVHFIAVYTPNPGGNSPKQVKESYDYSINKDLYERQNLEGLPLAYELLAKYIALNASDKKIVVVTEDSLIPRTTIDTYTKLNAVTIYVSNHPRSIIANDSVVYFGIDRDLLTDEELIELEQDLITHYTFKKIKQLGIKKICQSIKNTFSDKLIHLIIDLQIIDQTATPSVKRSNEQKEYMSIDQINQIIEEFKISYLDICGFDDSLDDAMHRYSKLTGETCRTIIRNTFNIQEKSINIFTEDSRFLIYRPVNQITDDDIGWYILRFMTLREREIYLKTLIDSVITITVDPNFDNDNNFDYDEDADFEIYVTSTSVQEQNQKSFYAANSIFDYCLFPKEKLSMAFELLNAEKVSLDKLNNTTNSLAGSVAGSVAGSSSISDIA